MVFETFGALLSPLKSPMKYSKASFGTPVKMRIGKTHIFEIGDYRLTSLGMGPNHAREENSD